MQASIWTEIPVASGRDARISPTAGKTVRRTGQPIPTGALLAVLLVAVTKRADAYEFSGGLSVGWLQAGTVPHFAIAPRAAMSWRTKNGLLLSVHDLCSILPPSHDKDVGIYNQTAVAVGYAWKDGNLSAGPSIAAYAVTTCGDVLCGRIGGVAVGGHVQTNLYIAGSVGLSVVAELDRIAGSSLVLSDGMVATVVAGPVVRWGEQ